MQNKMVSAEGFLDIHHHLIYGLDADGPKSFEETCAMLNKAQAEGIEKIIATPHVIPGIQPFDQDAFYRRLKKAREYCLLNDVPVEIWPGAEILYTPAAVHYLREKKVPTLAGTSFVLIEFSKDISFRKLHSALYELIEFGFNPIIAHVERYKCLLYHPRRAIKLRNTMNIFYQMNCSAVLKSHRLIANYFCRRLLLSHAVDWVATDAHDTIRRPAVMKSACEVLMCEYGREYAEHLLGCDGHFFVSADRADSIC